MIAQKCMRRLWFVEVAGEETRIFYGKGAKTRARLFVANRDPRYKQANLMRAAIELDKRLYVNQFPDDFENAPIAVGPWTGETRSPGDADVSKPYLPRTATSLDHE